MLLPGLLRILHPQTNCDLDGTIRHVLKRMEGFDRPNQVLGVVRILLNQLKNATSGRGVLRIDGLVAMNNFACEFVGILGIEPERRRKHSARSLAQLAQSKLQLGGKMSDELRRPTGEFHSVVGDFFDLPDHVQCSRQHHQIARHRSIHRHRRDCALQGFTLQQVNFVIHRNDALSEIEVSADDGFHRQANHFVGDVAHTENVRLDRLVAFVEALSYGQGGS